MFVKAKLEASNENQSNDSNSLDENEMEISPGTLMGDRKYSRIELS